MARAATKQQALTPVQRAALAILAPVVAAGIQMALWHLINPLTWILFYPAVFFSALLGEVGAGLIATAVASALGWYFFTPPELSLLKDEARHLVSLGMFSAIGAVVSLAVGRIRGLQRVTDEALRSEKAAAERAAMLFQQASDGILVADASGRYTAANAAVCRMLGYSAEELVGKTTLDLVAADQAERLKEVHRRLLRPGAVQIAEWNLRRKDGSLVPVEISTKILADGRWQKFVRDVSDRRRAERLFKGILEAAPDALVVVDGEGRIVFTNDQMLRLFGYQREELLNRPIEVLVPEDLRARHVALRTRFFERPELRQLGDRKPLSGRRRDGSTFPLEIGLSPFQENGWTMVTATLRDVTKRRLEEQELHESKLAAEAASRTKSDFLASMSHEIRTPLGIMLGYADMIFNDADNKLDRRHFAETIRRNGQHLLALINDILDLSKVEAGKIELESRVVGLVAFLHDLMEQFRRFDGHPNADHERLRGRRDASPARLRATDHRLDGACHEGRA